MQIKMVKRNSVSVLYKHKPQHLKTWKSKCNNCASHHLESVGLATASFFSMTKIPKNTANAVKTYLDRKKDDKTPSVMDQSHDLNVIEAA